MKKHLIFLMLLITGLLCSNYSDGQISGTLTVCVGGTTTLTGTPPGGTWSASSGIVTVSSSGVVTGVSAGTVSIIYSSGATIATAIVTVSTIPVAPHALTGDSTLCVGASITLHDITIGDVWSSSDSAVAVATGGSSSTLTASGVVVGLSAGIAIISYSKTNACGTATATRTVTVSAAPVLGVIGGGSSSICVGATTTFSDSYPGGTWTSIATPIATIDPVSGVATGLSAGSTVIDYTASNTCGTSNVATTLNVVTSASAGTIMGSSLICIGIPATLTDGVSGGTWSCSNSNATISGTGVISATATGMDTVTYSVTASCGSATATQVVTIGTPANPGIILGLTSVCAGATITLTDTASGGTWTTSATTIADVVSSGVVTGVAGGNDTIYYSVSSTCGTFSASLPITVNPLPSAMITGSSSTVCTGSTLTLSASFPGGTWSESSPLYAAVSPTGLVTGISDGIDTIFYAVSNSCGSASGNYVVTVLSVPTSAGVISGPDSVCQGHTINLSETMSGGIWNVSNIDASVSAGTVTGINPGTDTVYYTIANVCGSYNATYPVMIIDSTSLYCTLGVAELKSENSLLAIYPNPASGSVMINIPSGITSCSYSITDILGRQQLEASELYNTVGKLSISLLRLQQGTYIIRLKSDGKNYFGKIIVQ